MKKLSYVLLLTLCVVQAYAMPAMAKDGYRAVVIDQAGNRVFAVNEDTEGIDVIDVKKGAPIFSILSRADIEVLAVDDQRKVLAAGGDHNVSIISTETLTVLSTIRISGEPTALAVDSALGYLLIATERGKLTIVDLTALRVVAEMEVQGKPKAIAVDPTLHRAIVVHHTWGEGSHEKKNVEKHTRNNVSIIDLSTLSVITTLLAGKEPVDVAVNSITHEAAVANEKSDDVTLIDLGTSSVKTTISVDKHPSALYYNVCLNTLAVIGKEHESWLTIIDPTTQAVQVISGNHDKLYDIGIHNSLNKAVLAGKAGIQFVSLPNPLPHLDAISPDKALRGGDPFELTIHGTGFLTSTEIYLNGIKTDSSFKTCGMFTVPISASHLENAGSIEIKALNPTPQGGTSNVITLAVENPVLTILALQPSQVAAGSPDLTLTIIGSGFFTGTQLFVNSAPRAFTYLNATTIQTQLTAVDLETGQYITISTINPQPGAPAIFTVLNPLPAISSLSPTELIAGSTDATISITGENFVKGSSVLFNGQPITTKYVSMTSIEATIAAALLANPGSFAVGVSNSAPGGGLSAVLTLLIKPAGNRPAPLPDGSFGKQYENLVPSNATMKAYDPKRFSIVTGLIVDRGGIPISGVAISIHGHAEYGSTETNSEGRYSLPIDGGTTFTMVYEKTGLITSHRQVYVPWNDIAITETITMIAEDTKATTITFDGNASTILTHTSTSVTDSFGTRTLTMVFTGDNRATVTDASGNQTVTTTVITRATEFDTPESMPAKLPPTSAYTYCSELSVDGATHVKFDKPVTLYVDNFLGFDVGEVVPVGYYDRVKGKWISSDNGVVVRLLDTNGDGIADELDSNGDGLPDDLNSNGSYSDDAAGLADTTKFRPNTTYLRVNVDHFSPWDFNWPYGPPEDAIKPNPEGDIVPDQQQKKDDVDCTGSYCERRSRVFHEDVPVPGTDMTLHYASNRVSGYKTVVTIPVSGQTLPASLSRIMVRMSIAGRVFQTVLPPLPNQKAEFVWDGLDHLGNPLSGTWKADISIGFSYQFVYYSSPRDFARAWEKVGDIPTKVRGRGEFFIWNNSTLNIKRSGLNSPGTGVADGWTFSSHHRMNPWDPNTLIKGDGTTGSNNARIITTVAGNGFIWWTGDNRPAIQAGLNSPTGVAVDAAGNMYIADHGNNRIRRVDAKGIITTVAGGARIGTDGDNVPATQVYLYGPTGLALDATGNIYIADSNKNWIRKVDTNGIITTVAGNGSYGFSGDNGPATNAVLGYPSDVAVDTAGNIYIADEYNSRIRKVDTSGIITTVAGNGLYGFSGDNGPAVKAELSFPRGLTVDAGGNIYIADSDNNRIRKIDTSGIITTIAGNGSYGFNGDAVPATQTSLDTPIGVELDAVGNIYIADAVNSRVRKVDARGIITTMAGNGSYGFSGDDGFATQAAFAIPYDIAVDAGGNVYISDLRDNRVRKVSLPGIVAQYSTTGDIPFIEENGISYVMSHAGLHKSTNDLATGKNLINFGYDERNRLVSITDRFGNQATIQRNSQGIPESITSPDGQVTGLTIDSNNQLSQVIYSDGSYYSFGYTTDGLMTDEYDRRNSYFIHQYDSFGRITDILDPEKGTWNYARTLDHSGSVLVTVQTGEGNLTSYQDRTDSTGAYTSKKTNPTGEVTTVTLSSDGITEKTASSCGTTLTKTYDLDPLYKFKYVTQSTTTISGGLSRSSTVTKTYEDTNNDNTSDLITDNITRNGNTWATINNTLTGVTTAVSPLGREATATYDIVNLLTQNIAVSGLYPTTFNYDTRGRLTSATTGSRTTAVVYDTNGYYDYIITPDNRKSDYTYDVMGNLRSLQRPDGSLIQYDYNLNGSMTVLTNPMSVTNTFDYTANNQRKTWTAPLSGSYSYTFDKERKLKTIAFPSGKVISNTYTHGLLTSTTSPEGATSYAYSCGNNLSGAARGNESVTLTYDGSLIKSDTRAGTVGQAISYEYNNDFNLSSITYAGFTQSLGYDNDSLLITAAPYTITLNAQNGLPETVGDGNLTLSKNFNGYGELDQSVYSVSGTQIYSWTLSRDTAGRITQKIDVMPVGGVVWDYAYDTLGRLKEVKQSGSIVESYEYDANGNRTFESNAYRGTSNRAYAYSLEDHVLTAGQDTYQFDADGFLTSKITSAGTTTFTYSSRGELLSAALPDGRVLTYDHDPMGRRIAKRINGTIIEKYLSQGATRLLAVYDGSNNLVMRFTYADGRMPISMTKGGVTFYLFYDQIGSLRAVVDANGTIIKELVYDAFGYLYNESNPAFTVPFGFAGGFYDKDTGLVRFGARDYDPTIGRWTAKDPIDFAGGDINLFGYVGNNPVNWIDPLGLVITPDDPGAGCPAGATCMDPGPYDPNYHIPFNPNATFPWPTITQEEAQKIWQEAWQELYTRVNKVNPPLYDQEMVDKFMKEYIDKQKKKQNVCQ